MKNDPKLLLSYEWLRSCGAMPHYFGLGFIQIKISKACRLHFWVDDWPVIPGCETELHNHRYDFCSTVLKGALEQSVFCLGALSVQALPGDMEVIEVDCSIPAELPRPLGFSRTRLLVKHRIDEGQSYWLGHEAFHVARPLGTTITLVERQLPQKEKALVLRPINSPFVCPFSVNRSEEECWQRVKEMLLI